MEDVPESERPLAGTGQGESEVKEEEPSRAEYVDADDVESTETDVDTHRAPGDPDGSGERGVPDTETQV
jgi:hypothetical protein